MIPKYDRAWKLFEGHPERWTQGHSSDDKDGRWVESWSTEACRFCVLGALANVYGRPGTIAFRRSHEKVDVKLVEIGARDYLPQWNDDPSRKFEEVVALLKELDV